MARTEKKSFIIKGRIPSLGITYYERGGKVYARSSTRKSPSKQTFGQFAARCKMRHSIALWRCFDPDHKPLMQVQEGLIPYNVFLRANASLPTVFLTKPITNLGGALLMPQMVVSTGHLPQVEYRFETLEDGSRVVLTNLATRIPAEETRELTPATNEDWFNLLCLGSVNPNLMSGYTIRFYRFEQLMDDSCPRMRVNCLELQLNHNITPLRGLLGWRFLSVGGHVAIADANDENMGWAVVLYDENSHSASPQQVLTTCRFYEQYITDEASAAAADSFGNVALPPFLTPNTKSRG